MIFFVSSLTSCYTATPKYLYAAHSVNLLQTEKKGDLKAAINYTQSKHNDNNVGKEISNGIEIQSAYSVLNNFVVKADVFQRWETDQSGRNQIERYKYRLNYKRSGVNVSVGYYKPVGKQKQISLNIDGGIGLGKTGFDGTYREDIITKYFYSANHSSVFITPSVALKPTKNYFLIIGYRLSSVNFFKINTNDISLTKGLYAAFANKRSSYRDVIIENQWEFNKLPDIKFHWQIGFSKLQTRFAYEPVNTTIFQEEQYEYNNSFGSFGIIADIKKIVCK